jgi:hypothetical protein
LSAVVQKMAEMKMDVFNESPTKTDFLKKKVAATPLWGVPFQEAQFTSL